MDILPPTEIAVLYRIFPVSALPREADTRNDWLQKLWQEKDENLQHFNKFGQFPKVKSQCENGNAFPEREHILKANLSYIFALHLGLIACTCALLLFWGFVLKTILMML